MKRGLLRRIELLEARASYRNEVLLAYCADERFGMPVSAMEARRRANLPAGSAAVYLEIRLDPADIRDLIPLPENQTPPDEMAPVGVKDLTDIEKPSPPVTPPVPIIQAPAPAPAVIPAPWYAPTF